jgi:DNA-binding transcriptional MerR regulator
MTDQKAKKTDTDDLTYDIATVSRLTGLTSANLRVWEKRYQAVTPTRSPSGRRQYSREDLQRLTLLKTLTGLGHSISSSARLPIAELERRIEESAGPDDPEVAKPASSRTCRICIVGSYVSTIFDAGCLPAERAVKTAVFRDLASAEQAGTQGTVDLLVVECPALLSGEAVRIERLISRMKALRSIVIYTYSSAGVLKSLEKKGAQITAVRAPVSPRELMELCEAGIALATRSSGAVLEKAPEPGARKEGAPGRQFSERQLGLISQITPGVKCECPHHLVSLLKSLNGFEAYSLECENENAADAEIHEYLYKSTVHARSIIEDALKVLLEFEGISIED